jgi:hypothetical protein
MTTDGRRRPPTSPMALPKTRTRDAFTNMAWPEAARFLAYLRRAKTRPSLKSVSLAIKCNKQCNKPENGATKNLCISIRYEAIVGEHCRPTGRH